MDRGDPSVLELLTADAMVYGIGIDILEVERIEKELERSKKRFCQMVYTPNEQEYCFKKSNRRIQAQCLAGRFSAKEAFLKALGTGLRDGIGWKDIEVLPNSQGQPTMVLKDQALRILQTIGITTWHVSISHTRNWATAVVVLEKP